MNISRPIASIFSDNLNLMFPGKITQKIGKLSLNEILKLDDALKLWLSLK